MPDYSLIGYKKKTTVSGRAAECTNRCNRAYRKQYKILFPLNPIA
jgi:hypothetical protein